MTENECDESAGAQRRGNGENEQHEHAAVDRPARRAAAQVGARGNQRRRPAAQRVEHEAGHEIDDAPQSRLGQRREQRTEDDPTDRRGADLGEIGEQRRQRGEGGQGEHQAVQRRPPRRATDADQRQQLQRRLAEDEQHGRAADEHLDGKRREREREPADFGHVPIGAEQDDELEQEGRGDEAERLDRPQRPRRAEQRRQRAAEIEAIGDRRIGDVEAQRVRPRTGQLPECKRIIALISEQGEGDGVDDHRRYRQGAEEGLSQQRESGRAGETGDHPFARRQRRIDRCGEQRRADRSRDQRRLLRTALRGDLCRRIRASGNLRRPSVRSQFAAENRSPTAKRQSAI